MKEICSMHVCSITTITIDFSKQTLWTFCLKILIFKLLMRIKMDDLVVEVCSQCGISVHA